MGFFDEFKKKRAEHWRAEEAAKKPWERTLFVPFEFPYSILKKPKKLDLLEVWKSASHSSGIPLIVVWDDNLMYRWYNPGNRSENVNLDTLFKPAIDELFDPNGEDDLSILVGSPTDKSYTITQIAHVDAHDSIVCLAQIPVEHPWQIFQKIPFGDWNECPDDGVLEAFLKRLYENYGAVPVVLRGDTLELIPQRKPKGQEAFDLALQMYAFCPDSISQGVGTIHAFAKGLENSDVWQFWWD